MEDILAFHRRDTQMLAERVEAATLHKGLAWQGLPACLTIRFAARRAEAELAIDGAAGADATGALRRMVAHMLGLTQPVEVFEQAYHAHPQLGPLIARHPGLRVPQSATPFEALSWAVTGQQISIKAALSLRRKFIQAAGLQHSGGLWCYPDAERVAALSDAALRAAGFSQGKTQTLIALSGRIAQGELPLDDWRAALPVDDMRERLLAIRGIGPWTVSYALLRGFAWLDGSLHGDVAVRRNLQALLGADEKLGEDATRQWLAPFSPWRALVAAHLWRLGA
ncbi:DNA-3-methyladenine glycosylase 2 [Aromatoleum diolicum]|uniref:DNA-3-methyladenine glycosylase 2 n=1 Tax=Aromatoleum diolicum TaxID=75796 RepID=UPI0031B5AF50